MTTITKRNFLKTGLCAGIGAGAGMYWGAASAQKAVSLSMTSWGSPAEVAAFNALIERYKARNPNVAIKLEFVPSGQYYQQLDTRFAGKQAPDIFRAQYQRIGRYGQSGAAIDLSQYLDAGFGQDFLPSVWRASIIKGKPHALPHHTDTFALFYNAEIFEKLGIEAPKSLDKSWSWQEFISAAKLAKEKAGLNYAFAMNWQNSNAYRWLMYLYQHGGQLLDNELKGPQINTKEAAETVAWTQSWFKDGLVPPNTSLKSLSRYRTCSPPARSPCCCTATGRSPSSRTRPSSNGASPICRATSRWQPISAAMPWRSRVTARARTSRPTSSSSWSRRRRCASSSPRRSSCRCANR